MLVAHFSVSYHTFSNFQHSYYMVSKRGYNLILPMYEQLLKILLSKFGLVSYSGLIDMYLQKVHLTI